MGQRTFINRLNFGRSGLPFILGDLGYREGTIVHCSINSYIFTGKFDNRLLVGYLINLVAYNQYRGGASLHTFLNAGDARVKGSHVGFAGGAGGIADVAGKVFVSCPEGEYYSEGQDHGDQ